MARHMVSFAVVLLAAACLHSACADSPSASASALSKEPKNIEEEYFNPSIRSVLGEGAHQPLSTGKVLTQLGEFEIVNEGPADATGDIKAATPQFTASYVVYVNAVSGTTADGDALVADGPYGMWSLDAEQRFFWMPAGDDKAKVTIEGRADFPKSVTIKGKFGGSSPAVATLGRIGTRGAMPRSFPINVRPPVACSYTWTSPDSGCNSVFTGTFSSTPSFAIKTNIGGFAYAGLYQDSLSFNKYAEVTCTIDPESAKVEPCKERKEQRREVKSEIRGDA